MADDDKDEYESLLKLVIMGDSSVGKSNYICRFVDGKFNPVHVSTVGFDFKSRIFEIYLLSSSSSKLISSLLFDSLFIDSSFFSLTIFLDFSFNFFCFIKYFCKWLLTWPIFLVPI